MKKLEDYLNIGVGIAEQLKQIGVHNFHQLKQMGSKKVILRMRENNQKIDVQTLYKLEACIRQIPWHQLSDVDRYYLHTYYHSLDAMLES